MKSQSALALLLLTTACQPVPTIEPGSLCAQGGVVTFTTDDGVNLEADWTPPAEIGNGALVLLHMIPPGNDRSGYPERVRAALAESTGRAVLNVDRRGAGGSEGVAVEAYEGPGAGHDAAAAVRFLTGSELSACVDPDSIVFVGASNGTTAVMDYAAAHPGDLPAPEALVWMSPGGYTENQNAIADHRSSMEAYPMLWLFPTNEPWSLDFEQGAPADWRFVERGTQHGTRMFDGETLEEDTVDELMTWLSGL